MAEPATPSHEVHHDHHDVSFWQKYVFTTDHIPADSDTERPSLFRMSSDGTQILWHYAP